MSTYWKVSTRLYNKGPFGWDKILFHPENSRVHTTVVAMGKPHEIGCLFSQPPYSSNLAPSDYLAFPNMKYGSAGKHFGL